MLFKVLILSSCIVVQSLAAERLLSFAEWSEKTTLLSVSAKSEEGE